MGTDGQKPRTSPLVLLSLCLSLFAVALAAMALLMVYDQIRPGHPLGSALQIQSADWNWEGKIARVEKYLDRVRATLSKGGEKSNEAADEQMGSIRAELDAWRKAAEPRLQETISQLSKQTEDVRAALKERSAQVSEKLEALAGSLRAFRDKIVTKTTESPPKAKTETAK